ncbi:receptor kinase-like protein Xa21 [Mangifera indica]|uniref:receptor kinase-like protein Xa21 n=1 Tax=Mangifera indica TaxID=29780 RepID=UPI001CFA67FC|nr:receptor kinase-like protein Xa21 [Mangifera indica]
MVFLSILLPTSIAIVLVVLVLMIRKKRTRPPTNVDIFPGGTWRRISYLELMRATNEFSENNLLGKGSYGSVYKGRLDEGMEIAVKVFHLDFERALTSFEVECEVMRSLRHRNLVKIISSCSNGEYKSLIMEYMPNGNLGKLLFYEKINVLDISHRLNIMIDVASALEYLHFGYSVPIVHCDLKPSNVLLDENMVAHLSDFGISKLLGEEDSMTQTKTLATIGYMAPEYGREGKVSRKGDVYSYGIMLMETFTKKKPTNEMFTEEMSLRRWVGESLCSTVTQVVDTNLFIRDDEHFSSKKELFPKSGLRLASDYSYPQIHQLREVAESIGECKGYFRVFLTVSSCLCKPIKKPSKTPNIIMCDNIAMGASLTTFENNTGAELQVRFFRPLVRPDRFRNTITIRAGAKANISRSDLRCNDTDDPESSADPPSQAIGLSDVGVCQGAAAT